MVSEVATCIGKSMLQLMSSTAPRTELADKQGTIANICAHSR